MGIKVTNLTYSEANELIKSNDNLKILDVRSFSDYKHGHIPDALNLPLEDFEFDIEDSAPEKVSPLLVYCRTGRRSHLAIDMLKELNYTNIYHLYEGLSEWPYDLST